MANEGDIHLDVSEAVMGALALLSLSSSARLRVDAGRPLGLRSLLLVPPPAGPFITGSLGPDEIV